MKELMYMTLLWHAALVCVILRVTQIICVCLPGVRHGHSLSAHHTYIYVHDVMYFEVLFCQSYMSCYMFVWGELYLIALPHTIPHMHGELKEQHEVAPVAL